MKCYLCKRREAIYLRRYAGQAFCPSCFKKIIERTVRRNICQLKMLEPDDRIVVAISGGKDSLSLLRILYKIERKFPRSELIALLVDEGIGDHREAGIKRAKELCKELGIELVVKSFKEFYGRSLPEILEGGVELGPCTVCGILKRKIINVVSRELGADKVATAHNLDDWAQTVVINMMRGTLERLLSLDPKPKKIHPKLVPRIAPFFNVREEEIALYAYLSGFDFSGKNCPHIRTSMRYKVRLFLNAMEREHPGIKYAILGIHYRIRKMAEAPVRVRECKICGEPTSSEICQACAILERG